jgi:hypothetical protein
MQSEPAEVSVPLAVRLLLGRAAVQVIAADIEADLLHIKGNAVDKALRPRDAPGTDIDVMVRPTHVGALDDALARHGWLVYSSFIYGSPFGHAQTYRHPDWGYLDLHRMFPGIRRDPEEAFDELWRDRPVLDGPGRAPGAERREVPQGGAGDGDVGGRAGTGPRQRDGTGGSSRCASSLRGGDRRSRTISR